MNNTTSSAAAANRVHQLVSHVSSSSSAPVTTMTRPLDGKLAIVTGASQGIGEAIATHLASKGSNVSINYWPPPCKSDAIALAAKLSSEYKIVAHPVEADIGSDDGGAHLVAETKRLFSSEGSFQIDIIVNNAGVALNGALTDTPASTLTSYFLKSYRINVLGPMLLVQAAGPYLPTDRSGRIISLSSVSASLGFVKQSIYGGTKAAIESMSRTWAREFSERATVNCVSPGPVLTTMYYQANDAEVLERFRPFLEIAPAAAVRDGVDSEEVVTRARKEAGGSRPGYPEEIAAAVGMLCSEDARWLTGQVVSASGGMIMMR